MRCGCCGVNMRHRTALGRLFPVVACQLSSSHRLVGGYYPTLVVPKLHFTPRQLAREVCR